MLSNTSFYGDLRLLCFIPGQLIWPGHYRVMIEYNIYMILECFYLIISNSELDILWCLSPVHLQALL